MNGADAKSAVGGDEGSTTTHDLPTTVRAAETSFDEWGSSLPVPPPADAEASTWEAAPTAAPAEEPLHKGATETVDDPRIPPGQTSFKIGEVAKIVGVKPYVLRYWESELAIIRPDKTSTRQRRYRREDVALLLQVRRLRHDEKLPVARIRVLMGRQRDPAHTGPIVDPAGSVVGSARASIRPNDRVALSRELDEMRQTVMALLEAAGD